MFSKKDTISEKKQWFCLFSNTFPDVFLHFFFKSSIFQQQNKSQRVIMCANNDKIGFQIRPNSCKKCQKNLVDLNKSTIISFHHFNLNFCPRQNLFFRLPQGW